MKNTFRPSARRRLSHALRPKREGKIVDAQGAKTGFVPIRGKGGLAQGLGLQGEGGDIKDVTLVTAMDVVLNQGRAG